MQINRTNSPSFGLIIRNTKGFRDLRKVLAQKKVPLEIVRDEFNLIRKSDTYYTTLNIIEYSPKEYNLPNRLLFNLQNRQKQINKNYALKNFDVRNAAFYLIFHITQFKIKCLNAPKVKIKNPLRHQRRR